VLCEAPSEEDYADGTLKKRQLVMELDMATWRVRACAIPYSPYRTLTLLPTLQRAIEVFDITEPKIPQRPPVKQDQRWSG
jgi:hypothetical protein